MIKVAYMNISSLYEEELQQSFLEKLSDLRKQKAEALKPIKERARSIGAGLLLEYLLSKELSLSESERKKLKISYTSHGKPFLVDYQNTFFNLSHSGDYVACAISDQKIGIDLQAIGNRKENVEKRFYSKEEQKMIGETLGKEEQTKLFFQIWTGKESYTKWLETGLTIPLSDFSVDVTQKKVTGMIPCNLKFFDDISGYSLCVAFEKEPAELFLKEIFLEKINF